MILATFSSCCCCSCSCCSFCSKGSSRIGKRHALTAAAAAKLRNTWRHQPLLQYCLYLLLLLLAAVAVRLLWACCCRCYCHCCCSAAAPLESFPRPVVVFLVVHNLSSLTRSSLPSAGVRGFFVLLLLLLLLLLWLWMVLVKDGKVWRLLAVKQLRKNHLPAGKHHASEGRASSKSAPKNSLTCRLKS